MQVCASMGNYFKSNKSCKVNFWIYKNNKKKSFPSKIQAGANMYLMKTNAFFNS